MKILFSVIILGSLLNYSFGQSGGPGIYLSADDFSNNKISFAPTVGKRYKMSLHEVFYTPYVNLRIGDSTYSSNKDAIWGYLDEEKIAYRFYRKHIYEVLDPGETILLYSRTSLGGYRNSQTTITYYFSANADAPVQILIKENLKASFPTDTSFHELLDLYFRNDSDLLGYDGFYKMYKLNHVFQLAQHALSKKILQ